MRNNILQLALAICLLPMPGVAQQRASAQQNFPARPMPPDVMAPQDSRPAAVPKPERNALPQSDQPAATSNQQRNPVNAPAPVPATKPATMHKARKAKPSPVPTPEPVAQAPAPPPPPPTMQQMPPSPPQVQYRDGLLTVSARNSTLSDVLNAVRAQTGANMTLPPGMNDRLFLQIGPAPPRDVISKLLSGTNFDYVLAGSPQNPNALQQVIVTPRQGGPVIAAGSAPQQTRLPGMGAQENNNEEEEEQSARPQQPQPGMPGGFGSAPGGPGPFQPNPAMAPPNVANPTPFPQTPGPTGVSPVQPQVAPNQPPQMPPNQPPQGGQPKTPYQLYQEMLQMRQQQQQQQQQQQKPPQ